MTPPVHLRRAPPPSASRACAVLAVALIGAATSGARAQAEAAPPETPDEPAALPDALPPLDDALIDPVAGAPANSPLRSFAQLRLRGELDESRDLSRVDDASAGAALTGRVGVDAALSGARLVVVVGDGARLGGKATAPPLVRRPALPVLWQAELALDLEAAGLPAVFALGRMPVVVGDGRLLGVEPFDPRGRTLDGARLVVDAGPVAARAGALWLAPADASDGGGAFSGVGFVELALQDGPGRQLDDHLVAPGAPGPGDAFHAAPGQGDSGLDVMLDGWGILHRDGAGGLTTPTAGVRLGAALPLGPATLLGRTGVEVQAPLVDGAEAFSPAGTSARAHVGLRAATRLSPIAVRAPDPFVDVSAEITAGDVVAGRVLQAPAPTQHGFLGLLDLVAPDNTWAAALAVGGTTARGLFADLTGRLVGIVDPDGPLLDTAGAPVRQRVGHGLALLELDARLELPLTDGVSLGAGYGIAVPGAALVGDMPAQRLYVTLRAQASSDGDTASLPVLDAPAR